MESLAAANLPFPLLLAVAGLLGACIGSFLTLVTWRLPRDEKIGMTRSRCPSCSRSLNARDLVPIYSWIFSGGKCRYCKTGVSIRYPLIELGCALGTMAIVYFYGPNLQSLALMGLWWCIVSIFITDLEHTIILDEVQIAIALFGLMYGYANDVALTDMIEGAAWGLGIGLALKYGFLYFRNKDGLGLGDVKFLAAAGVWLGSGMAFVPFLFFSGVLGIASSLLWRLVSKDERFPFGPALAIALLVAVVMPQTVNGFWNLYGLLH